MCDDVKQWIAVFSTIYRLRLASESKMMKKLTLLSLLVSAVISAPLSTTTDSPKGTGEIKLDLPVAQLEKLKQTDSGQIKSPEDLVARIENHTKTVGQKPLALEVQKEVSQDGDKAAFDGVVPTAAVASEDQEPTTKVFHGAARLISQASSAQHIPPAPAVPAAPAHSAHRRSPTNADFNEEYKMDQYSPYYTVPYVPLEMAEYVFWTGDEVGVTMAIEDLMQQGKMSKEDAIAFLQETKLYIDYLNTNYNRNENRKTTEEQARIRHSLLEQAAKENYKQYQPTPNFQTFPYGNSPDIVRSIPSKTFDLGNRLTALPVEYRQEPVKRTQYLDPMMQTNIISTSDYDRDGPVITEEEYEEIMEKLKAADTLYTEYTLEEIIYQLAKLMFSQSLTRDPREARASIQRFMSFLEMEAERGQLSRNIEKKVLDVMIAALTDAVVDHPEQIQPQEPSAINPGNRLMHQYLENNVGESGISRAILAAYKDELLKGPMHKLSFPKRN